MNKKLGPGVLILLGTVLLYLGGVSGGGGIGAGLSVGGLVCLVIGIISGIRKLFGNNIEKTTKSTARTILTSFMAVKKKYNLPIETPSDKVEIYTRVLKLRPGYSNDVIHEVLQKAQEISEMRGESKGISLNSLVFIVVVREYTLGTHKTLTESQLKSIQDTLKAMF